MTRRLRRLKKSRQWPRSRKQERRDGKRRREEIVARGEAGASDYSLMLLFSATLHNWITLIVLSDSPNDIAESIAVQWH